MTAPPVRGTRHVVVIGGGFGGLAVARALGRAKDVSVTLVDRENHHLFQPLLYQVATAGLSPGDITMPIRSVLRRNPRARVLMGEVMAVDLDARIVTLGSDERIEYDHLVIATGTRTAWLGHFEGWSEHAVGLKTLRDALTLRERILMAFEAAEREPDPKRRAELLTFVVIGGGATGVETAGAISELSRHTLRTDFRVADPTAIRVLLVERGDRLLGAFSEHLSRRAREQLEELSVEVWTGRSVTGIGEGYVEVDGERTATSAICWATGVEPVSLAERIDTPHERRRLRVERDCSLPGHPDAFAIGDIAWLVPEGAKDPLPGLAPVAMQQGRYVASIIARALPPERRPVFRYRDKGSMATIGRSRAVAQVGRLELSGYPAWVAWLVVHLVFLIGYRTKLLVLFEWFWSYVTFRRGARVIARSMEPPGRTLEAELRREHGDRPAASGAEAPAALSDASPRTGD